MNIYEYQAKEILKENGISVPLGVVIDNIAEMEKVHGKLKQRKQL